MIERNEEGDHMIIRTVFAVAACVVRSFTRSAASELTKMFPPVAVRFSSPETDPAPPVAAPSANVCGVPVLVPRLAPLNVIDPAVAVSVEAPSFTLLTTAAPVVSLPTCTLNPVPVRLIAPELAVVLVPAVFPSSAVADPVLIVPAPLIEPAAVIVTPPDTAFAPAPPPLVFTAVVDRF